MWDCLEHPCCICCEDRIVFYSTVFEGNPQTLHLSVYQSSSRQEHNKRMGTRFRQVWREYVRWFSKLWAGTNKQTIRHYVLVERQISLPNVYPAITRHPPTATRHTHKCVYKRALRVCACTYMPVCVCVCVWSFFSLCYWLVGMFSISMCSRTYEHVFQKKPSSCHEC